MGQASRLPPPEAVVEIDDTLAGTRRDVTGHMKGGAKKRRGAVVVGMKERGGRIRATVTPDMRRRTAGEVVREAVDLDASSFVTDGANTCNFLEKHGERRKVRHYMRFVQDGDVHTCNVDSFWGLLKRGIDGSFHHVSDKHLHRYLSEFEYRHNHRGAPNMMDSILVGSQGKRLTYGELAAGQKAVML